MTKEFTAEPVCLIRTRDAERLCNTDITILSVSSPLETFEEFSGLINELLRASLVASM